MHGRTGTLGAISSLAALAAAAALAAGPAGAATAAPWTAAARSAAARTTAAARPAAGRPLRGWAATLLPGHPGTASAADGSHAMTPQARAAATSSSLFSGAALEGVSCTGRKQCTATGLASTRTGKNYKPLAERWNGTTWAKQTTPIPNSGGFLGGTLIAGVSCTSSSACMAAGYAYSAKTYRLLGEGWNGRTWSIQADSTPAVVGEPFHISCTWAKDCSAVGQRNSGSTLAEHWNGRRWSTEATKHTGELDGVSCPATGNCTAVGWNNADKVLAAHWNGKAWSDESAVNTQPATFLEGVSCPATTACIAVGTAGTASSTALVTAPLAEEWTGGTWTALTVPDPGASGDLVGAQLGVVPLGHELHGRRRRPERCRHRGHHRGSPVERHDLGDRRHAQPGDVQRAPLGVVHVGHLLLGRGREQRDRHGRGVAAGRGLERQHLVAADRSGLIVR